MTFQFVEKTFKNSVTLTWRNDKKVCLLFIFRANFSHIIFLQWVVDRQNKDVWSQSFFLIDMFYPFMFIFLSLFVKFVKFFFNNIFCYFFFSSKSPNYYFAATCNSIQISLHKCKWPNLNFSKIWIFSQKFKDWEMVTIIFKVAKIIHFIQD